MEYFGILSFLALVFLYGYTLTANFSKQEIKTKFRYLKILILTGCLGWLAITVPLGLKIVSAIFTQGISVLATVFFGALLLTGPFIILHIGVVPLVFNRIKKVKLLLGKNEESAAFTQMKVITLIMAPWAFIACDIFLS